MPDEAVSRTRLRLVVTVVLLAAAACASAAAWWRWPRRPPVAEGTAVVVSPHPDDETYAMGQTVAAQVAAGNRVVGVLVTDGETSLYAAKWAAEAGSDMDGDGDVDEWDFGLARREEYREAMGAAGVAAGDLVFLGRASSQGATGLADGSVDADALEEALDPVVEGADARGLFTLMRYTGRGVFGRIDGDAREHPDHTATYEAVRAVARASGTDAWFFKLYVAYQDPWKRLTRAYVLGDDAQRERKRAMTRAYSIGASSTPELWEYANESAWEFLAEAYRP